MRGNGVIATAGRLCLALVLIAAVQPAAVTARAADPASIEAQMLALINQDRAQAGLAPVTLNGTMASIARNAPIQPCPGSSVHGRAEDMIERSYLSHQIPPCNANVFPAVQAAGVQMSAAGEAIGFNTSPPDQAAAAQNAQWLNSPEHRATILGNYNQVGIGAWPAPGPWSAGSVTLNGVIMFDAIFASSSSAAPGAGQSGPRAPSGVNGRPPTGGTAAPGPQPTPAPNPPSPAAGTGQVALATDGSSPAPVVPAGAASSTGFGSSSRATVAVLSAGVVCGFLLAWIVAGRVSPLRE